VELISEGRKGLSGERGQVTATQTGTQAVDRAETTLELSYLSQVSKYLTVQPDLQYVIHPNTVPSLANAWVLQARFEIAF